MAGKWISLLADRGSTAVCVVSLTGQFPGEKGLVAPGMSCHFPIRFAPDSLKDYDDQILIQTQSSKQMMIKILGRREPPCLTSKLQASMLLLESVNGSCVVHVIVMSHEHGMKLGVISSGSCILKLHFAAMPTENSSYV